MELVGEKRIWNSLKWSLSCAETRVESWVSHSQRYNFLRASSFFFFLWDAFHQQTQNPFNRDCVRRSSINLHLSLLRFSSSLDIFVTQFVRFGWVFRCNSQEGKFRFDVCLRVRFAGLVKEIRKRSGSFNFFNHSFFSYL